MCGKVHELDAQLAAVNGLETGADLAQCPDMLLFQKLCDVLIDEFRLGEMEWDVQILIF